MKVGKSNQQPVTSQETESSETTKGPKGAGTSPRTSQANTDTVEMSSAAETRTETSGARQLTSDQQAKAGKIDPENLTSLRSTQDPRAAIESARSKNKPSVPADTGKMPNGQSTSPDLSKYNAPTNGMPDSLKESIGKVGQRGEQLKGFGRNATEMFTDPLKDERERSGAARDAMNAKDGALSKFWNWLTGDDAKETVTEATVEAAAEASGKTGGAVVETLAAPLTGVLTLKEVGVEEGYLPGWQALLGDPARRPGMPGVRDVPPDIDGTGGSGVGGTLVDSLFPAGDILKGVTGKGPRGGEVVNPSPEATGGGKGWVDDHGASETRLTQDNSQYLIGQPAGPDQEPGFNGLSGSGAGGRGGNVDFEDGSGYQGALKTEEPGQVQTGPTSGDLGHLINNDDDQDDNRRK